MNNLGTLILMSGDAKEAAVLFGKALAVEPGNSGLMLNMAAAKLSLGEKSQARRFLERACEADPENLAAAKLLHDLPK